MGEDGAGVARCRRLWQGEVRVVRLRGVLKDSWLVRVLVWGIGRESQGYVGEWVARLVQACLVVQGHGWYIGVG